MASKLGSLISLYWSDLIYRADLRRLGIEVVSANPAEAAPDGAMGYIIEALFDWKAVVLVALRDGVTSDEVCVAHRALKTFVERVVVKGAEFRIDYRADLVLALGEVPPRGCMMTFSCLVSSSD